MTYLLLFDLTKSTRFNLYIHHSAP